MEGEESESEYSYHSGGGSFPNTPLASIAPIARDDCVQSLLCGPAAGAPASAAVRPLVTFYTAAEAAALVNAQVTEVMAALAGFGAPVTAERALLLLQATGSTSRVLDTFSRELGGDEGSSSSSSSGGSSSSNSSSSSSAAAAAAAASGSSAAAVAARRAADAAAAAARTRLFANTLDTPPPPPPPAGPFTCDLSGEDYDSPEAAAAAALTCGHYFSGEAWQEKLAHAARAFPSADPSEVHCAASRCHVRVPLSWWLRALPAPAARAALREAAVRSVLLKAPGTVVCPGAGCDAWCVTGLGAGAGGRGMNVKCPAGHIFCSGCGETQAHQPATCLQVREWKKPANNEGAMEIWKSAIVNGERRAWNCPSCRAVVEKNAGCKHFTHAKASGGCGHEFCWSCLKPWPCKANYGCHEEPEGANAAPKDLFSTDGAVNTSKLFFWAFERFNLQDTSLDAARKLAREVRAGEVSDYWEMLLAPHSEVFAGNIGALLGEGAEALLEGYTAAKWTYVYAWSKNSEPTFLRGLFENAQGLLERAAGALRGSLQAAAEGFLHKKGTGEGALALRKNIMNERDQLKSFMARLMTAIEGGGYEAQGSAGSASAGGGGGGAGGGR